MKEFSSVLRLNTWKAETDMVAEARHQKAKEIFDEAVQLRGDERQQYLEQTCLDDERLLQEVERMLESDPQADGLWEAAIQKHVAERLTAAYEVEGHDRMIGEVLSNRFLIQSLLGEGGIGRVYKAVDLRINSRPVAVKLLREDRYKSKDQKTDEWLKRKFLQEAEALSRVRHPGVVMVLDRSELADGRPFFVMEWVEGRPLRDAMRPYGMDFEQAAAIVQQIGQALTAVHSQQVVHRDLKPENIMLQSVGDGEERIKLIEFGIAKVKDSEVGPETSVPMVVGSLAYLAPEQILSQAVTAATDTYALGVIAYEMLTGRLPFNPDSQDVRLAVQELHNLQQAGVRVRPRDLRSGLPEAAEGSMLKAISFGPAERHGRSKDFGEELMHALMASQATTSIKESLPKRKATQKPEQAYVLFADIVEHSKQDILRQKQQILQLNEIARSTSTYRQAKENGRMISLPRGDAVALAFFEDLLAGIECAIEIAKAVQAQFEINVRIGLHAGPVLRVEDINANQDIAGGGINLAQRVMDCGDAGHILLSKSYADFLLQMGSWTLHDLGEHEVKQGLKIHLYNFTDGDVGNPETPSRLRHPSPPDVDIEDGGNSQWLIVTIAAAIFIMIAFVMVWRIGFGSKVESPSTNSNLSVADVKLESARALSYSVSVQMWRGNKSTGDAQEMFGDLDSAIYFRSDDRIRLNITASQDGYLYLLNEGPRPASDGEPVYTVLFPSTADNDASALIEANRRKTVPRTTDPPIGFVGSTGTEKVWLIWSATPVSELEMVKRLNSPTDRGAIRGPSHIAEIQKFLAEHSVSKAQAEKDESNRNTRLRFAGDILVHLVKLEHR